jgi:hypothetical protein
MTEMREKIARLKMPNGDTLICDYPASSNWARSWSIQYVGDNRVKTTQEQDWEIVERYGLTDVLDAVLALYSPVMEENERLRAAISWIEPPFVDSQTSVNELRKRVQLCLVDAKRATLSPQARNRMDKLELAERIEAATGPDRELNIALLPLVGMRFVDEGHPIGQVCYDKNNHGVPLPNFTQSLDAALTLVPEGWRWIMREACPTKHNPNEKGFFARLETRDFECVTWGKGDTWLTNTVAGNEVFVWAATPALALCAAALRARHETEGSRNG